MTLRIGINLHNKARSGQNRSAAEKEYLPQFLKQLNPSAIVVMDDFEFAQAMYTMLPNTITIYRQYNPAEGHLWQAISPEQYVLNQTGITKSGIPLYVLNEMDSKAPPEQLNAACKWMARVMDLLAVKGCIGVFDNAGPRQPVLSWFTDDVKWNAVKPLFDAFKRHPQMYWGLHPYWENADMSPLDSSAIHRQIEPLLKKRGYDMPFVIFSETGRDAADGGRRNSWRAAGITEEQYAAEIIKARNTLWTESYIRGACIFCYGSTDTKWGSFDIESNKVLHSALVGANAVGIPTPTPQPEPIPTPSPVPSAAELSMRRLNVIDDEIALHRQEVSALYELIAELELEAVRIKNSYRPVNLAKIA